MEWTKPLSLVVLGVNQWTCGGHHQKVAFMRQEMRFIKTTHGYVVIFYFLDIRPRDVKLVFQVNFFFYISYTFDSILIHHVNHRLYLSHFY